MLSIIEVKAAINNLRQIPSSSQATIGWRMIGATSFSVVKPAIVLSKETILRTGLNRPFLDENRRDSYEIIKELYLLSQNKSLPETKRLELKKIVRDCALPDKEYSLMIKCAIKNQFRY